MNQRLATNKPKQFPWNKFKIGHKSNLISLPQPFNHLVRCSSDDFDVAIFEFHIRYMYNLYSLSYSVLAKWQLSDDSICQRDDMRIRLEDKCLFSIWNVFEFDVTLTMTAHLGSI